MHISLNEHLTGKKIFFAVIAPICMMVFSSLYTIVDGVFMANLVGGDAFAGNNLVWPFFAVLASVGFMLGTGGAALVGKLLGEKQKEKANQTFSLIVYVVLVLGILFGVIGFFAVKPFANLMAKFSHESTAAMVEYGITYGRILSLGMPAFMLQLLFQSFFSTAEKPYTGFLFILGAGIANILLDALFMGLLSWGVEGAAFATIIGYCIGGLLPILYFRFSKKAPIRLGKAQMDIPSILQSAGNGISEFVSNISASVLAICYNAQLLRYVGPVGVSFYGIIQYFSYTFMAIFIGYTIGISPFVSYQFGAQNKKELHYLLKRSLMIVGCVGVGMFLLSEALGPVLAKAFASGDPKLEEMASYATRVYSFVFLTCGFSVFGSAFFTALNNGLVSGIISIVRTLVFELSAVFLLPLLLSVDGIWSSAAFAEIGSTALTIFFFVKEKKRYGY